jgi:uncharacterized protein (TIGR02246 family)
LTEEDAVLATLEAYAEAYCAKDIDHLMAVFDDGDDISLIGTGANELCSGRLGIEAVFRRNFADATATRFQWHWRHVTVTDGFAVVATTVTIHIDTDAGPLQVPVRWTVALVRRGEHWRWLHRHASSAAQSQEKGTAYPTGSTGGRGE